MVDKTPVLVLGILVVVGLSMFIFSNSLNSFTGLASLKCTDSDEINGISSIFFSGSTKFGVVREHDACVGSVLVESYCDYNGRINKSAIKCENGCFNGKCVISYCKDWDGLNYKKKGITSGVLKGDIDLLGSPPMMQSKNYTDRCFSDMKVMEYFCAAGEARWETFKCSYFGKGYMCVDGGCVKS